MDEIVGSWRKTTSSPRSERYPDRLELSGEGRVRGEAAADARVHPLWDVGGFEVTGNDAVAVSLSNGGRGVYRFSVSSDVLAFEDEEGCRFEYERVEEAAQ